MAIGSYMTLSMVKSYETSNLESYAKLRHLSQTGSIESDSRHLSIDSSKIAGGKFVSK